MPLDLLHNLLNNVPISIKKLWANRVHEVSAGTIIFYCPDKYSKPLFLLIERGNPFNDWVFPKGKIKAGETLEQAALRETKEETGLDVIIYKKLISYSYTYYWEPANERATKTVHYFLASSNTDEISIDNLTASSSEANSFIQIRFFSLDEAVGLVRHQIEKDILHKAAVEIQHLGQESQTLLSPMTS